MKPAVGLEATTGTTIKKPFFSFLLFETLVESLMTVWPKHAPMDITIRFVTKKNFFMLNLPATTK
jgi:hypothetical protein